MANTSHNRNGDCKRMTPQPWIVIPWGANELNQKAITVELPDKLSCLAVGDHWNGTSWIPDNSYHIVGIEEYDQPDFVHPVNFRKGAVAQDQILFHAWAVRYTGEIVESTVDHGCKVTEAVRRPDEEIAKEQDKLDDRGTNEKAWPWEWQTRNCKKCCIYKIRPKDMVIWTDRYRHQTRYDFARYKLRK